MFTPTDPERAVVRMRQWCLYLGVLNLLLVLAVVLQRV